VWRSVFQSGACEPGVFHPPFPDENFPDCFVHASIALFLFPFSFTMDAVKDVWHTLRRMNYRTLIGQTVTLGNNNEPNMID
jgi:hypothetical protein